MCVIILTVFDCFVPPNIVKKLRRNFLNKRPIQLLHKNKSIFKKKSYLFNGSGELFRLIIVIFFSVAS